MDINKLQDIVIKLVDERIEENINRKIEKFRKEMQEERVRYISEVMGSFIRQTMTDSFDITFSISKNYMNSEYE